MDALAFYQKLAWVNFFLMGLFALIVFFVFTCVKSKALTVKMASVAMFIAVCVSVISAVIFRKFS